MSKLIVSAIAFCVAISPTFVAAYAVDNKSIPKEHSCFINKNMVHAKSIEDCNRKGGTVKKLNIRDFNYARSK